MSEAPPVAWHRKPFGPISQGAARAFAVLSILTVLLSGAAYWFAQRAVQGEIASRATVVQLCEAGNTARAQQQALWEHIIAISVPPPHETPAQKQHRELAVRKFEAYVRTVFAKRNCQQLPGG